jgi:hypothetical protein
MIYDLDRAEPREPEAVRRLQQVGQRDVSLLSRLESETGVEESTDQETAGLYQRPQEPQRFK